MRDAHFESMFNWKHAAKPTNQDCQYLIYNRCDGWHVVEAHFDETNEFQGFYFFAQPGNYLSEDFYEIWIELPDIRNLPGIRK